MSTPKQLGIESPQRTRRVPRKLVFSLNEYGYTIDGDFVPAEYLVRISSFKHKATVVGLLQEDIHLKVDSHWEPLVPTSMLSTANILVQAITGGKRSAITRATTRRLWMGSSPMVISLKLKFEAVNDAEREVVMPGRLLQSMTVPSDPSAAIGDISEIKKDIESGDIWGGISKLPALEPPGPSPFNLKGLLEGQKSYSDMSYEEVRNSAKGGDFIMIELGTFLTFWNVIIKENDFFYKKRFTRDGDPISAEANIMFETYEMPTVESLRKSYTKTDLMEIKTIWAGGNISSDLTGLTAPTPAGTMIA